MKKLYCEPYVVNAAPKPDDEKNQALILLNAIKLVQGGSAFINRLADGVWMLTNIGVDELGASLPAGRLR